MATAPDKSRYLAIATKFTKLLNVQKITHDEYASYLLQQSALETAVDAKVARQIIDGMPEVEVL